MNPVQDFWISHIYKHARKPNLKKFLIFLSEYAAQGIKNSQINGVTYSHTLREDVKNTFMVGATEKRRWRTQSPDPPKIWAK